MSFTSGVRGWTSVSISGNPTFEQKGENEVTIKGAQLDITWVRAEISDSTTPLAQDLMTQIRTDLDAFIAGDSKSNWIKKGSQSSVVLTDLTTYGTWSVWGPFGSCDEDTCTKTRRMECANLGHWSYPHSQIPCGDPNSDNAPTEKQTCTSEKCGKFNCSIIDPDVNERSHVRLNKY